MKKKKRHTTCDLSRQELNELKKEAMQKKIESWQPFFVERTRKLITKNNMQIKELADRLEIPSNTLSEYISKTLPKKPKANIVYQIAEIFEVSTDYLFARSRYEDKVFSAELSELYRSYGLSSGAISSLKKIVEMVEEEMAFDVPPQIAMECMFRSEYFQTAVIQLVFALECFKKLELNNNPEVQYIPIVAEYKLNSREKEMINRELDYRKFSSVKAFDSIYDDIIANEMFIDYINSILAFKYRMEVLK